MVIAGLKPYMDVHNGGSAYVSPHWERSGGQALDSWTVVRPMFLLPSLTMWLLANHLTVGLDFHSCSLGVIKVPIL